MIMNRIKNVFIFGLCIIVICGFAVAEDLIRMDESMSIDSFSWGRIVIGEKAIYTDVIILPDGVVRQRETAARHFLTAEDIQDLLSSNPDIFILGNGVYGRMNLSGELSQEMQDKGIQVLILRTPKAVKKFQELRSKDKKVSAYFHITC